MSTTDIEALLAEASRLGLVPRYRWGTTQAASGTKASILIVTLDGDDEPVRVYNTFGTCSSGARVWTVEVKPHGIYALGSPNNTAQSVAWTAFRSSQFGTNWANTGSGFRNAAYRLTLDGKVELAGLISQSGTVGAPNTMLTLPTGYTPVGGDVQMSWTVSNNPASTTAPTPRGIVITTAGLVRVTHFAGTINPGPISLDGLSFALTTV